MTTPWNLYYWPMLPGRGEFIRLAFEAAGARYVDVARAPESDGGGVASVLRMMRSADHGRYAGYAAPFVERDGVVLSQVANILHTIAPELGLAPASDRDRSHALQLQLTHADVTAEAHDTHHPVSNALYYEDQIYAAKQASASFVRDRLPKLLGYFEQVLAAGDGPWFFDDQLTYVDLSMAHVLGGIVHAFPTATEAVLSTTPTLVAHRARVDALPAVAAYRASDRWMPFNEHGVFRYYEALDDAAREAVDIVPAG